MSDVKHTPGPWTLTTVKTSCGICHKIGPFPWRDEKENHACVYVDYPNHGGYMGPRETELLANARLIAAAPDLLEVLKGFAELADVFDIPGGTQPTTGEIYTWSRMVGGEPKDYTLTVEMLRAARAAIAKAQP